MSYQRPPVRRPPERSSAPKNAPTYSRRPAQPRQEPPSSRRPSAPAPNARQQPPRRPPMPVPPKQEPVSKGTQNKPAVNLSFLKYLLIGVGVILGGMLIVKLAIVIIDFASAVAAGFGPFVQSLSQLADQLFQRFISAIIGAIVISMVASMILGDFIPYRWRGKIFPLTVLIALIYTIAPALGTAVGQLLIVILGLAIILSILKR